MFNVIFWFFYRLIYNTEKSMDPIQLLRKPQHLQMKQKYKHNTSFSVRQKVTFKEHSLMCTTIMWHSPIFPMRKYIVIKLAKSFRLKTKQLFQIISTEHCSLLRSHSAGGGNVKNLKLVTNISWTWKEIKATCFLEDGYLTAKGPKYAASGHVSMLSVFRWNLKKTTSRGLISQVEDIMPAVSCWWKGWPRGKECKQLSHRGM